jgi:hypothetical protein
LKPRLYRQNPPPRVEECAVKIMLLLESAHHPDIVCVDAVSTAVSLCYFLESAHHPDIVCVDAVSTAVLSKDFCAISQIYFPVNWNHLRIYPEIFYPQMCLTYRL